MSIKIKDQTAEDIVVLRGLESVWQNPARYIGDLSTRGMHHLVDEIVANSIDEAMSGFAKNINIVLHSDNIISIEDDGRGIPTEIHPTEGVSALELVLTTLDAGGKMKKTAYEFSGGLHGVGLSVVNALSEFLEVEVKRNNKKYFQRYEKGKAVSKVTYIGKTNKTGTKITFKPDENFFKKTSFKTTIISNKLKELAFINNNIRFSFLGDADHKEEYFFEDGLTRYISELNDQRQIIPSMVVASEDVCELKEQNEKIIISFAWQYNDTNFEKIKTYANSINTPEGGTHEAGFRSGFIKAVNDFIELKLKGEKLDPIHIREGLTAIVSIKIKKPEFESQTKTKLTNLWVRNFVSKFVYDKTFQYLMNNIDTAKEIYSKVLLSFKAALAAKRAKALVRRKSLLENITSLPGKIADCETKDFKNSEIFIVEGDSAGGSAKQARNRKFQAILPLKGKILNVERKNIDEVLKNDEIQTLIQALNCGVDSAFDIEKLRYHKIIIMTDADSDGSHIRNLLLTFFYRLMPEIVNKGYLYVACPPLYKIKHKKTVKYLKDYAQFNNFLTNIAESSFQVSSSKKEIIEKKEFKSLINSLIEYSLVFSYISNQREALIVDFILRFTSLRKESLLNFSTLLKEELNSYVRIIEHLYPYIKPIKVVFNYDEEDNVYFIFHSNKDGKSLNSVFDLNFFNSPEFKKLENLKEKFKKLSKPPYYIQDLDKGLAIKVEDIFSLLKELLNLVKAKLEIQRYKGLGEMNPDELWTTTMNPETRTILNVEIEDNDSADNLTYTLMGDNVESRKAFIDMNALKVKNLDV